MFSSGYEDADGNMHETPQFVGTPLYAAPEMLYKTCSSPAMDYWALGCMIYELLVG